MNRKKWLGYNAYKKLWSIIGGRKWTHIMRDFAYQSPLLLCILFFALGMWLRPYVDWNDLWKCSIVAVIIHVLWGAKWIKGQGIGGYSK